MVGALLSTAPAKAALTLSSIGPSYDPPNTADRQVECLKGQTSAAFPVCPTEIEENFAATAERTFKRINRWDSNDTGTPPGNPFNVANNNMTLPVGTVNPFTITYAKSTETATFSYFNTTVISAANLTRSPSINSLFFRTASAGGSAANSAQLTNLVLSTVSTGATNLPNVISQTQASSPFSRETNYLVVNGLPDEDFTITGDALITGANNGASWQMKAVYTPSEVPGPLPVLGGMAAFGWSRRLRSRLRQVPSPVSA